MMKVVSVINYKGGVGKTTLTANLGAYAASQGKRVLMIDLDPQASLTFSFMSTEEWRDVYSDSKTMKNYFEPITRRKAKIPALSSLVIHLDLGRPLKLDGMTLDLLSSHLRLIDIDTKLANIIVATDPETLASSSLQVFSYLRNSLAEISGDYDLVMIDCPPNSGIAVKNALAASDCCIIPARLDYLSTLGISNLKDSLNEYLEEYGRHINILGNTEYQPLSLKMLGVVPMMVNILRDKDESRNIEREIIGAQQEFMARLEKDGVYIFTPVRNNPAVFGSAPVEGVPAVLTRPKFYQQTARKIVRELQELGSEFLAKLGV